MASQVYLFVLITSKKKLFSIFEHHFRSIVFAKPFLVTNQWMNSPFNTIQSLQQNLAKITLFGALLFEAHSPNLFSQFRVNSAQEPTILSFIPSLLCQSKLVSYFGLSIVQQQSVIFLTSLKITLIKYFTLFFSEGSCIFKKIANIGHKTNFWTHFRNLSFIHHQLALYNFFFAARVFEKFPKNISIPFLRV